MPDHPADDLTERVARLTLEQKADLLTGATPWLTRPSPVAGLRAIALSDGPAGVRGTRDVEPLPSAAFPNPTALAATWDVAAAERLGAVFAAEARRQDVDVVLAPTMNLQRTPYGGRHFENYSEDPVLTAGIAAALVTAIQRHGVGTAPKHLVANESETERTSYVARVDEATLREVYLAPFEAAVEAGAWTVMAAYNGLDDGVEAAPATEHRRLLRSVLKDEWGFDGLVMSDWMAATTTVPTARAGLDLVMPGPDGPWNERLVEAVRRGDVDEAEVDDKVLRLLRLAGRVGALDGAGAAPVPAPDVDVRSELRTLAGRAMVLLRNRSATLPLTAHGLERVALIGPNAVEPHVQGDGSAHVNPEHVVTPADGLRAALGPDVVVEVEQGCDAHTVHPTLAADLLASASVTYLGADGTERGTGTLSGPSTRIAPPDAETVAARLRLVLVLDEPGTHDLVIGVLGRHRTAVDGGAVWTHDATASEHEVLTGVSHHPPGAPLLIDVAPGERREVNVDVEVEIPTLGDFGRWSVLVIGHRPPSPPADELVARAVAAAERADVAVVVVGTNDETESEGFDRPTLALAGAQDALVRAVAAAARRTVVVVNSGSPVLLPWLDEVDAVLWAWLPGQEAGHALADVLLGGTEPAGRLPWTLPASEDDLPVRDVVPVDGVIDYREGALIGYRGWDAAGAVPAAPFGFGLGYGAWRTVSVKGPAELAAGEPAELTVEAHHDGGRTSRHVVQVYVEPPGTAAGDRRLAAFAVVEAGPDAAATATLTVPARAFQRWRDGGWVTVPGRYALVVGGHSRDDAAIRHEVVVAG